MESGAVRAWIPRGSTAVAKMAIQKKPHANKETKRRPLLYYIPSWPVYSGALNTLPSADITLRAHNVFPRPRPVTRTFLDNLSRTIKSADLLNSAPRIKYGTHRALADNTAQRGAHTTKPFLGCPMQTHTKKALLCVARINSCFNTQHETLCGVSAHLKMCTHTHTHMLTRCQIDIACGSKRAVCDYY